MSFALCWDGSGLLKRFGGYVSAEEFMDSADASFSHPDIDRARYIINDFSNVTGHGLCDAVAEYVGVMRMGASLSTPNLRVLYISTDESIRDFVAALTAHPFHTAWETRVFPTMSLAEAWLKLQPRLNRMAWR
ncbi:hypothetical protein [Azonexus sp.]|uniref:hypothetical protein n=1 Tax=Azonexus sp. TaxID=1872668 RepID=UPI0035B18481